MDKTLQFSDIPRNWAICYQSDCPFAVSCLRYHAATLAPADLRQHMCVLPGARSADTCYCFVENRPVRLVYGMKRLLNGVTYEQGIALRSRLYDIFGSSSQYYRFREGRWPISPNRQARIANLFRTFGLDREPEFDAYATGYCFEGDV